MMKTMMETRNGPSRSAALSAAFLATLLLTTAGCQQKMADQPAHRPYEENKLFEYNQAARPLETGVVHRNQLAPNDPMIEWLTPAGKQVKADAAWIKLLEDMGYKHNGLLKSGTPNDVGNFVSEFPFTPTFDDLKRGQVMFNANCALCHGAQGDGNGKIVERGFLRPPSYHRDPEGKKEDYSRLKENPISKLPEPDYMIGVPQGSSRGFGMYNKVVYLTPDFTNPNAKDHVPVGYIFQVITQGYRGMASHEVQVQSPEDRWRIVMYIWTLQLHKGAPISELNDKQKLALQEAGVKN